MEDIYELVLLDYNYLTSPKKLMEYSQKYFEEELEKKKKIVILGATSGDTGSAALEAFKSKKKSDIFID